MDQRIVKNVKSPSHYTEGRKFEPKDVIREWMLNFNLGSAIKYIARAGKKDDIVQDLKKAQEFIQFEIDAIEAERKENERLVKHPNCRCSVHPAFADLGNGEGVSCGVVELEVGDNFDPHTVAMRIVEELNKSTPNEKNSKEHITPVTELINGDTKMVRFMGNAVTVPVETPLAEALFFLLEHFVPTEEE